jgi:RHS repeat-associated protein
MNRLQSYVKTVGGPTVADFSYTFAPTGERFSKRDNLAATEEAYMYDSADVVADYSKSGTTYTLLRSYLQMLSIDSKVARVDAGGEAFYYVGDALGSVNQVLRQDQTVANSTLVNAWGEDQVFSQAVSDRHGFTQRERDEESGLSFFRARAYDPRLGRFGQKDPLLKASHVYDYAGNNPVIANDPLGLLSPNVVDPEFAAQRLAFGASPRAFSPMIENLYNQSTDPRIQNLIRLTSAKRLIGAFVLAESKPLDKALTREEADKFIQSPAKFNMGVFTVGMGWIDMGHFLSNARLQYAERAIFGKDLGLTGRLSSFSEVAQDKARILMVKAIHAATELGLDKAPQARDPKFREFVNNLREGTESAFTIEDEVSNARGRDMGMAIPLNSEWGAGQYYDYMRGRFKAWGAVSGKGFYGGAKSVREFLRKEVEVINRAYSMWSVKNAPEQAVQAYARVTLGGLGAVLNPVYDIPYPPRNMTGNPVVTPATRIFGDGTGRPKKPYEY